LDGLRGIAIGLVLIVHYFQVTGVARPGSFFAYLQAGARLGWSGVDLFFVLSGFLIGGILIDARNSTNYFQVFYRRRFFRIVPIYAAVLLFFQLLVYVGQWTNRGDLTWLSSSPMPWYTYWTFTQNFWMARFALSGAHGLAVTWSLALEEQFYLTLPLLVRILSPRWLLRFVLVGICFAPLLRISIYELWPRNPIATYVLMPCRADALLLGVLAAILLREPKWRARIHQSRLSWQIMLSLLFLGMGYLTWKAGSAASPLEATVGFTWIALFYASLLLWSLTQPTSIISRLLRTRWLGRLGSIAYGTYLIHYILLGAFYGFVWSSEPVITSGRTFFTALEALVATLLIAWFSWRYFEHPLVRIGHRSDYEFAAQATGQVVPPRPGADYQ
jgi:peptidoglycan/LPS O-acetylase OafA/YrhL